MQLKPTLPGQSGSEPGGNPLLTAWDELREIAWLVLFTGALSIAAVGLAVLTAAVFD
jgi:hypothetical protein